VDESCITPGIVSYDAVSIGQPSTGTGGLTRNPPLVDDPTDDRLATLGDTALAVGGGHTVWNGLPAAATELAEAEDTDDTEVSVVTACVTASVGTAVTTHNTLKIKKILGLQINRS